MFMTKIKYKGKKYIIIEMEFEKCSGVRKENKKKGSVCFIFINSKLRKHDKSREIHRLLTMRGLSRFC